MFRYTEKQLVPLRVTREKGDGLEIYLLLVDDGQECHSILILDLLRLVSNVKGTTTLTHRVLCRNCFHVCMGDNTYKRHQVSCWQHEPAVVKTPLAEKKLKPKNWQGCWMSIKPVVGCQNANQSTSVTKIPKPSGFCVVRIKHGNPRLIFMQLERSENCMEKVVEACRRLRKSSKETSMIP